MSGGRFCDDCGHRCAESCVYLSLGEQPKFVCFRLAKRLVPGEPWNTWDYMAWIRAEWSAFGKPRGIAEQNYSIHDDAFLAWLMARHGHPDATPADAESVREAEEV